MGETRSEVCWAAVTNDGRFAFVTNFGDGTVSSYAIGDDFERAHRREFAAVLDPPAEQLLCVGVDRVQIQGVRDEALSGNRSPTPPISSDLATRAICQRPVCAAMLPESTAALSAW